MTSRRADLGPGSSERFLLDFVGRVRKRSIIAAFCAGGWFAAVLNEVVRWGSVGFIDLTKRKIPVLDIGPLLLLVLVPYLLRRWSPAAAARRADAGLGLHDRLASFLDFQARRDVSPAFRDAQAAESARALSGTAASAVAPLRWWLPAGPVLLAVSLLYPLLVFPAGTSRPVTIRIVAGLLPTRTSPDGGLILVVEREGDAPGGDGSGKKAAPAGEEPGKRPEPVPPQEKKDRAAGAGRGQVPPAAPFEAARPPRARPKENHPAGEQPSQIESERVGASLTKVIDPLYAPGGAGPPAAPPPAGSLAFRLLPKSDRTGGAGEQAGESELPERVTVDFDALPEKYRPLVRTYFELLAKRGGLPRETTPPQEGARRRD